MFGPLLVLSGCSPSEVGVVVPVFEEVVAPPGVAEPITSVPVYGGTLEPVPALGGLVAADPPGDRLLRIVGNDSVAIDLGPNARPFRVHVEHTDVWVTLRGTGELVRVDLQAAKVTWRTHVCDEPRGVTRSPAGPLIVACADGPLVEVSDDGDIQRAVLLAPDLRDIVPSGGVLYVSRFASAELLVVEPTTLEISFRAGVLHGAHVAWRMRANGDSGVYVLHQIADEDVVFLGGEEELDTDMPGSDTGTPVGGSYGGADSNPCGRLHGSTITVVDHTPWGSKHPDSVQPAVVGSGHVGEIGVTDFSFGPEGQIALAVTGARAAEPSVVTYGSIQQIIGAPGSCIHGVRVPVEPTGVTSAVAFDGDGTLVVQSMAPTEILRVDGPMTFTILSRVSTAEDAPVRAFHTATAAGVSCASCHPEGGDDGHVWKFFHIDGDRSRDVRRTMPLAGELLSRAPYHWDALRADPEALMLDTFTERMGGAIMPPEETAALFGWLEGLRPVRANAARTADVVEMGRVVFTKAGCVECHAGPAFTDGQIHAVRAHTDEHVKTPSLLGVGSRAPLFHDGCAETLEARFEPPCEDRLDQHGRVSGLTASDIDALTAYLRTL